jgi:hypothetical protein
MVAEAQYRPASSGAEALAAHAGRWWVQLLGGRYHAGAGYEGIRHVTLNLGDVAEKHDAMATRTAPNNCLSRNLAGGCLRGQKIVTRPGLPLSMDNLGSALLLLHAFPAHSGCPHPSTASLKPPILMRNLAFSKTAQVNIYSNINREM